MSRRRIPVVATLAVAAACAAALPAASAADASSRHRSKQQHARNDDRAHGHARAVAKLIECERGDQVAERSMTVATKMRRTRGTRWMEERVDLLRHRPHEAGYTTIPGVPGLGDWKTPDPIWSDGRLQPFVGTYRLYTTVNKLNVAPAAYRVKATFRWHGRDDRVLRVRRRYSKPCFQTADGGDPAARSRRHHRRHRAR